MRMLTPTRTKPHQATYLRIDTAHEFQVDLTRKEKLEIHVSETE